MLNRQIPASDWPAFFADFSRQIRQRETPTYLHVRSLPPGAPAEPTTNGIPELEGDPWLPFLHIAYEAAARTLTVRAEGLEHPIPHPQQVWAVMNEDGQIEDLIVFRQDGAKDLLNFLDMQPHPSSV